MKMKKIQDQISSLSFLSSYKPTQTRVQSSLSDPQLVSGALIDVTQHLGNLSFRVWDKMKDKVHFSPFILDLNTAHSCLNLSDDLTSVRNGDKKQNLPDNPERQTKYSTVLGSAGFSSGTHSWEVEVGDHPNWNVGLVKESVDRKRGRDMPHQKMESGVAFFYDPEDMTHIFTHKDTFTKKLLPYFYI